MDCNSIVDNIIYFRHIRYPQEIIKFPKYIIYITNIITNSIYIYGSFVRPDDKELLNIILPKRVWENEKFISPFDYNELNYKIKIVTTCN